MAVFLESLSEFLTPTHIFRALSGALVFFSILGATSTLRQYLRLRHIRGPPTTGFSKWWLISRVTGGRTNLDLYEACQNYGDIARIGPNDLVTSDPGLMRRMLNARTQYKRSDWYYAMRFDPSKDNILSMRDNGQHHKLRAKMAHGYSGKEVENLEPTVDKNVSALVNLIGQYAEAGKAFDFGRKAQFFTLDVISNLAFGDAIGFLTADADLYDYCKIFETQLPKIIFTTIYPWLVNVLQWPIVKRSLPSSTDGLGFGKVMGLAREVAAQRYGPAAKTQRDMLGSFMAHGLLQGEAESEILVQLIAGSDTTATSVRATMLHIITNPRVLNALLAEISSLNINTIISDEQARSLPYLQAVIKEGLRIHPPVVGLMAKEVPPGGDTWKGVHLPGGTHIGYCAWGITRRPDVWGDDAAEFKPDRWLQASPEKLHEMESTLELVFGYGRWQCLGKNVALMELNKVFVELLRRFEFVLMDPTKPWLSVNVGIFIQRDFWLKAYERQ